MTKEELQQQLDSLKATAKDALLKLGTGASDVRATLNTIIAKADSINGQADSIFDKVLDRVEQSKYTAPAVIAFVVMAIGVGIALGRYSVSC